MSLFKTENDLLSNFELITKKYPLKRIKDLIVTWIELDKKSFIKFREITPRIDNYDRFHILGCLLLTFFENRGAKLVTLDKNILECTNEVLKFYSSKQKSLNATARKVLTLIGN